MAVPSSAHRIRVVLLDQYALIRGALRTLLEMQPQFAVVGEDVPGPGAIDLVAQHQPDIILLNLLLQAHALELIPSLLTVTDHARLLVVAAPQDSELHGQAVQLGASGVIGSDQPPAVLLTTIDRVRTGEVWANQGLIAQVLTNLAQGAPNRQADPEIGKIRQLTTREREVIALVAAGLRNQEIAQHLSMVEATVRNHLTSIFQKLAVRNRAALIVYAYRHGLVTPPL